MSDDRTVKAMSGVFDHSIGRVIGYESARGLGTLVEIAPDGRETGQHLFHCTAIAGGGREIDEGTTVVFRLSPVGPGSWEATEVRPLADQ